MSLILKALRVAHDMIETERSAFIDCHTVPGQDGRLDPEDAEIRDEYDSVLAKIDVAIQEADHDALRIMWTTLDKGHNFVLCVEPQNGGSKLQMDSGMKRIEIARMLERFARAAREDARFGGDE